MRNYGIVLFCLASFPALAQESPQYSSCSQAAKTQAEMTACASQEATRADAELNDAYKKLVSQAAVQDGAAAKIKASELAWNRYRDAYMDAMYPAANKQSEYGSSYPMDADLLRAKLSRRQVTALKEILQKYSDDEH